MQHQQVFLLAHHGAGQAPQGGSVRLESRGQQEAGHHERGRRLQRAEPSHWRPA